MADTAIRVAFMRTQLPSLESALNAFKSSSSAFRVVRTVNPPQSNGASRPPKTLYILDSSFNPPSIAHLSLATSALRNPSPNDAQPFRFLLLLSTMNADKAPSPANFEHRLALMTLFAEDLTQELSGASSTSSNKSAPTTPAVSVPIDIGLTTAPYYSDKSAAIDSAESSPYPKGVKHVHLVGYDTLIRFTAPKYYKEYTPPLSALAPFFEAGHKLRVTQRPANPEDESSSEFGTADEQRGYLDRLRKGELESEGFKPEWAERLDMVPGDDGVGVSSTRARKAANRGDWDEVGKLLTPSVAGWVKELGLYKDDARGAKMA